MQARAADAARDVEALRARLLAELPGQLPPALRAELAADLARAPAENLRRAATPIGVASVGWDAALASLG